MERMRFVALAFACVLAAGSVRAANEADIRDLQARLAAQEARMADQDARMADLQAKIASGMSRGESCEVAADKVISIQKNAKVTIGGLVVPEYKFTRAKVDSVYEANTAPPPGGVDTGAMGRRANVKTADLTLGDANIYMQIDVNEHFSAYVNMNLQNGPYDDYYNAKEYYVRWRNVCESGFGLLVGRTHLVFGTDGVGYLGSYAANNGDAIGDHSYFNNNLYKFGNDFDWAGDTFSSLVPTHNAWDVSGVTQFTPYWEGLDGKLKFEVSLMQNIYEDTPGAELGAGQSMYTRYDANGVGKFRSRNYGLGTVSSRLTYSPIEDLTFTLSAANYRSNGNPYVEDYSLDPLFSKNNQVYGVAIGYRPSWFNKLYMWGQWVHGQDVYFWDGLKSDALNFGLSFDFTERLTAFAQGDYLRSKYSGQGLNQKGTAWAFYTGMAYSLPYGVSFEAGWKHEDIKYKDAGRTTARVKADTLYGLVGFEF